MSQNVQLVGFDADLLEYSRFQETFIAHQAEQQTALEIVAIQEALRNDRLQPLIDAVREYISLVMINAPHRNCMAAFKEMVREYEAALGEAS